MNAAAAVLDDADRAIVNALQGGFPLSADPFAEAGRALDMDGAEVLSRIEAMLDAGVLSRFGPMYNAERLGGGLTLAAIAVPEADFGRVAGIVNAFAEVAHNYRRDHALNMWFVIATENKARIAEVIAEIEAASGLAVVDMPKIEEFFVGLEFEA